MKRPRSKRLTKSRSGAEDDRRARAASDGAENACGCGTTSCADRYLVDKRGYFSDEQRERTARESKKMAKRMREQLEAQRDRPATMGYFDEVHAYGGVRVTELAEARAEGALVVGALCVMVPFELVAATGARPIRLCAGYYEPVHPANELLGDAGLCPLVKSTLGSKMVASNPLIELVDLVIGPATCDGKMKLAEILEDWVTVIMLNVPRVKTGDTTAKLWLEEILYLKRRLEELTGTRITRRGLAEQIGKTQASVAAWRELMAVRRARRPPLSGQDALLVAQASQLDRIERWTKKVRELTEECRQRVDDGRYAGEIGAARVMLAGSPVMFPNFKLPMIIEESGGIIVYDELCSSERLLNNPLVTDETNLNELLRALAERSFFPCTCPCFSPNDERLTRMKDAIAHHHVEGVVYHILRGCHLNNLEATKIEVALRELGIPMLKLESEYDEGDVEQVRTRVEAFTEMIKMRRAFEQQQGRAESGAPT